mgnify:CR=1 FL=1
MKGYNDATGLFKSRYYAKKCARDNEIVVKEIGRASCRERV